ncbi:MAG TPA: prepilin-type N-terminal cleavage/methylation domain-containing protein [Blastocatellia bacterium]|nr:prepilin-type N-terminal cleavage/methylation domain-containing protein [Blastocatellia bacterium]
MKSAKGEQGFSLIEVTLALAVMTTILGIAFLLLNGFQRTYQTEEAYADAARNGRFAIARLEEIIRSAGTNPTGKTAVNWLSFVDFGGGNSGSSLHLISDLNGDGATSSSISADTDVIITSENVTLTLNTSSNTVVLVDNNQPLDSVRRTVPIAENIRSLTFTDPDGSRREVDVDLYAVPSGVPISDKRYREVHYNATIRLRNR